METTLEATYNPFGPMTPQQEADLIDLLAAGRGRLTRNRLREQLAGTSAGEAARRLAQLRGESTPPEPRLDLEPHQPPTAADAALRERLDNFYSTRHLAAHLGKRRR